MADALLNGISAAVAKGRKEIYNPLFIYGDALKTTEALELVEAAYLRENPKAEINHVSGEEYALAIIKAMIDDRTKEYRRELSECDMLIFGNVEHISGRAMAMKEFYALFDKLWESGRQIVIIAGHPPKMLEGMDERIRTQLESGIIYNADRPQQQEA